MLLNGGGSIIGMKVTAAVAMSRAGRSRLPTSSVLLSAQMGYSKLLRNVTPLYRPTPRGLAAAAALVVPLEICTFWVMSSVVVIVLKMPAVPHSCTSVLGMPSVSPGPLPVSLRASYQVIAGKPVVGSTDRAGMNWLEVPPSSLTRAEVLQVAPASAEKRRRMSVSFDSLVASS